MVTSFDTVRDTLGESAGPELVLAVESLPLDRVDALAGAILDVPMTERLPTRPVTEVWPLIPLRASVFFDHLNHESSAGGYSPSGVHLWAATDPRLGGTGMFSAGVIRALLYSHGLVIEDPLRHAAEMHLGQDRELREVSRQALSAAVASLSEIADLLDGDVVNLFYTGGTEVASANELGDDMLTAMDSEGSSYSVDDAWDEFEVEFVSGLHPSLQSLWRQIRGGNRSPDLQLVQSAVDDGEAMMAKTFIDVVRVLNPRSIVMNAIAGTAHRVATIELLGGSCDLLCSSPLMSALLFLGAPDPAQQLRVSEVARTTVPNIDALSPSDLVAIRRESEALARWREDLASALDYAQSVRASGVDSGTVQSGVEEMLAGARERLRAEARQTRVWDQGNVVNFVAGGLGGAGGAMVGGSAGAVAAGVGSGVLAAFIQSVGQRQCVPSFLDRHYIAFARPQE